MKLIIQKLNIFCFYEEPIKGRPNYFLGARAHSHVFFQKVKWKHNNSKNVNLTSKWRLSYFLIFTFHLNPLGANLTKWSNTLKQFGRIVWAYLTVLLGWRLKC